MIENALAHSYAHSGHTRHSVPLLQFLTRCYPPRGGDVAAVPEVAPQHPAPAVQARDRRLPRNRSDAVKSIRVPVCK